MTFLNDQQLMGCVDVVLVSSHGVAPSKCENSMFLDVFMSDIAEKARIVSGPVGRVEAIPNTGRQQLKRHLYSITYI